MKNLKWYWTKTKTGNYIAVCQPLAQTIQADTFTQLVDSIQEATESTFKEINEKQKNKI